MAVDPWLLENLVCPRDRRPVRAVGGVLECPEGHQYLVARDIPLMLLEPMDMVRRLVEQAERDWPESSPASEGGIDAFVDREIAATNGNMFLSALGRVKRYPIPVLRMPEGNGGRLLDVGCNWGRWLIAAARRGYRPVGIDPKVVALYAAQRVARQMGVEALVVGGDGRALPFRSECFDAAHSYGVIQHLARSEVEYPLREMGRVMKPGSPVLVQLPHRPGLRTLYQWARRGEPERDTFGAAKAYSTRELRAMFARCIGPATIAVDGYFTINPGLEGLPLVRPHYKALILASEAIRRLSVVLPPLLSVCDSAFIAARKSVVIEHPVRLPPSVAANTEELMRAAMP